MQNPLKEYQSVKFSKKLKKVYISSLLRHVGTSLVGAFGVIFFFQQFNGSLESLILFELVLFLIFLFLTPLSVRLLKTIGLERLMKFATPFLAVSMLSLYLMNQENMAAILGLYIASVSVFRLLYWVPYHLEFTQSTDEKFRGKQLAIMSNITVAFSVLIPVLSGYIISNFGFPPVFLIAMIVVLASMIPLFSLSKTYEEYTFGYWETFKKLFARENRVMLSAHFSNGMQTIVAGTIWPIYIFLLFDEKYTTLGIIASLSVVSLVILRIIIGAFSDKGKKSKLLMYAGAFRASGWILRMFVVSPVDVFATDTYYNAGKVSQQMTYTHTMYEHAQKNGSFVDEYTVLRESALNLGRVCMLLLCIPLIRYFPPQVTFIVAAAATLFVSFTSKERKVK